MGRAAQDNTLGLTPAHYIPVARALAVESSKEKILRKFKKKTPSRG
jgi:hypothetical protein